MYKIEHPRIFISYSWSSKKYEEKVMKLAINLQKDGIETIFDKWVMKPGNDTINFMEKYIKDPKINFVLILLDKTYTEKANAKKGGVGIETQIISNEVYNDVEQSKFIPIIFDRDKDGKEYIPTYLKSRFYYDLTSYNYNEEYKKLVKQIYGREVYYRPPIGKKPTWVDDSDLNYLQEREKGHRGGINYEIIGERLRNARKQKGYSQYELAEELETSTIFLSRIERGASRITLKRLTQLCEILEISEAEILNGCSIY